MPMLRVGITGNKETMAKIRGLGASLMELQPEMEEIGKMQAEFYGNEAFNSRGEVYGKPWAPLSEGYANWKNQNYPGRPMEVLSGTLRKSFGWLAGRSQVVIRNKATVQGKGKQYNLLALQQGGTSRMPARVIMELESTQVMAIKRILKEAIMRKIKE
jgi:phage gpG-like protein